MLLYSDTKEFMGVDQTTLNRIGFSSLQAMQHEAVDFADLFVNQAGLVYNFSHFSWIDFILHSDEPHKAHIRTPNKSFSCSFRIEPYYFAHAAQGWAIELVDLMPIAHASTPAVAAPKTPSITTPPPTPTPPPSVTPKPTPPKPAPESAPKSFVVPSTHELKLATPATYQFNPQVAADELGLPRDLIEEFVEDFIQQANKFIPEIQEALGRNDFDTIQILSHKLKGVAANLRIEDALEVLATINSSKDTQAIARYLAHLITIIERLSSHDTPVAAPSANTQPMSATQAHEEEDLYAFDFVEKNHPSDEADFPLESSEEEELSLELVDHTQSPIDYALQAQKLSLSKEQLKNYIAEFVDQTSIVKEELELALKTKNFATIGVIASTLKGMSETLLLDEASGYLRTLQTTKDITTAIAAAKSLYDFVRKL